METAACGLCRYSVTPGVLTYGPVQMVTLNDNRVEEKSALPTAGDIERQRDQTSAMRSITKPHLPSDFVRVDDLADDRPREAASLVGLGMGRANPRFDCTAP